MLGPGLKPHCGRELEIPLFLLNRFSLFTPKMEPLVEGSIWCGTMGFSCICHPFKLPQ